MYLSLWQDLYRSRTGHEVNKEFDQVKSPTIYVNTPVFNSQSDTYPTDFQSDRIKPKTGARIRDDFGHISVNTETNTNTPSIRETNPKITGDFCPDDLEDIEVVNVIINYFSYSSLH